MEILKYESGHVPLFGNLEGYWDKPLAKLPAELRNLVEGQIWGMGVPGCGWDELAPAERRKRACKLDQENDPAREPDTNWQLINYEVELVRLYEQARQDKNDSAAVVLNDVRDRIHAIIDIDRKRVGAEIQALRAFVGDRERMEAEGRTREAECERIKTEIQELRALQASQSSSAASADKPLASKERNTLLVIIAALLKYEGINHQGDPSAVGKVVQMTDDLGAPLTDDTIRKHLKQIPDAVQARS